MPEETTVRSIRKRVAQDFSGPSRTKQSFKDECDINIIMSKFMKTGLVRHLTTSEPRFGDFTQVSDYQTALNAVLEADNAFQTLPASIRARFNNAPAEFLRFVDDPANQSEMVSLGLATAPTASSGAAAPASPTPGNPGVSGGATT